VNSVTRLQLAKITTTASGWPLAQPAAPTFADIPAYYPLADYVETAFCHGVISGYACGGPGEACDAQDRPLFRPGGNATRGQAAKMIYNAITSQGCAPYPARRAPAGKP